MKKPFLSPLILITVFFAALVLSMLWFGRHSSTILLSLPDDMPTLSGQTDVGTYPASAVPPATLPVSSQGTVPTQGSLPDSSSPASDPPDSTVDPAYVAFPLNINVSTKEQLMLLPGIGEVLAQRIVDYRSTNGLFSSVEELTQVRGISRSLLEKIKDDITVGD